MKNESIGGWNCQCYSTISPSLTTYLSICPLSRPCSSVSSCRPNIVPTLVYKYSLIHYSMGHEPVGIVDSFLQDIRAVFVQLGVALPILHDTTYLQVFLPMYGHGLLVFLEDAVSILDLSVLVSAGNFRLKCHSGNSSFHHLLEHDLLLLVVSPRSFPLSSNVERYFLPLIGSLR